MPEFPPTLTRPGHMLASNGAPSAMITRPPRHFCRTAISSISSSTSARWLRAKRRRRAVPEAGTRTGRNCPCVIRHRINRKTGAQFEISIDGVPRTYRDQKDLALLAAQILKSRNPNGVVRLKDLKTGEEIVVAFKAAQ